MATSAGRPSRIHLKGQASQFEEAHAAGVIRPGHLLTLNVDGDVIPHDVAFGQAERMFALEDALQGRGIDDNYASGELVFILLAAPGDQVLAWLAVGQSVQKGDWLASDGAGHLVASAESGAVGQDAVAVAMEALDNSESDDNNARIKVRVL